jgi:hypothetical protein
MIRVCIVCNWGDGIMPISKVSESNMRVRNATPSAHGTARRVIWRNVNNFTILRIMGQGYSIGSLEQEGGGGETHKA